ncbi:MAG: OsmC family protein [Candidatus Thorarchaeota archaeon]|nr:OsmC family protein [Candidatus Thorarchaeota archaeon]
MTNSTFHARLDKTETSKIHSITLGGHQSTTVCPPPMLGEQPGSTSPHHLFLASIGACVNLVFEIALEKARVKVFELNSEINGEYITDEETGASRFESVSVETRVVVPEGTNEGKVLRLFDVAHANCPIGNCLVGSCIKLVTNLIIEYR